MLNWLQQGWQNACHSAQVRVLANTCYFESFGAQVSGLALHFGKKRAANMFELNPSR